MSSNRPPARALRHRWLFVRTNLQVKRNLDKVQNLLRRAKAVDYNGIVLADYKLQFLDRVPAWYFRHVAALMRLASKLGLEIYPTVCPIGYSNGLLSHNPNLAEGVPVRDAPFVAQNQMARLAVAPPVALKEHQTLRVTAFRQYHVSILVRGASREGIGGISVSVATTAGRQLARQSFAPRNPRRWTLCHIVFNSLDSTRIRISIRPLGTRAGARRWRNAQMEEVGLLNIIRRAGAPLSVAGENGTVYQEGRDFYFVCDERLGVAPYPGEYEVYHSPPAIRLTSASRIRENERLRVSFYHSVCVEKDQVSCCLSEPEVYALLNDQIRRVNALFHPRGFFLEHDEIRVANRCQLCRSRGLTPGQLLADNLRRCVKMIRKVNPRAGIFLWSDMFDPNHNARDTYYLADGSWRKSWDGLPRDAVMINWNFIARDKSLRWFSRRGHAQICAAYFDGSGPPGCEWRHALTRVPNIIGVMYTTWIDDYREMSAFAAATWGGGC